MTDHLEAARTIVDEQFPGDLPITQTGRVDWLAAAVAHILDHLEAEQASPEPDRDPECVKRWPECEQSAYDPSCCRWPKSCSCNALPEPAPDPLDETNHADRVDRDGEPWRWCDQCAGFRLQDCHGMHDSSSSWTAAKLDEHYGPLTFAPKPSDTPTTAPQPAQAHGDADEPTKPKLNVQTESWTAIYDGGEIVSSAGFSAWHDNIRAEAWDEGWHSGYIDRHMGRLVDGSVHIARTPNPYRKDQA